MRSGMSMPDGKWVRGMECSIMLFVLYCLLENHVAKVIEKIKKMAFLANRIVFFLPNC